MGYVNIGIDLGTTNSAIATYKDGDVVIHKNPLNLKDTLPSAVGIRNNKYVTGDRALSLLQSNPEMVFTNFKRLMGINSHSQKTQVDPIRLSQEVLKGLLGFLEKQTKVAVVTIPASFDTIQSNATKQAAYNAKLSEVTLLQEPIAACLAYANYKKTQLKEQERWLVYDYGGGTFDAALVQMTNGILNVIDHKGDNFLGGKDIDYDILSKIICKRVEEYTGQSNFYKKLIEDSHSAALNVFLSFAEEAKKILSYQDNYQLDIYYEKFDIDFSTTIKQSEVNELLLEHFDKTYELIDKLLSKNSLSFNSITRIVLVGGTTIIPFIQEELKNRSGTIVDTSLDPTTAIVVGAAYYAGTIESESDIIDTEHKGDAVDLKLAYESQSNDEEELILGKTDSKKAKYYRISRNGQFDTGIVEFTNKFSAFVPLEKRQENNFKIELFDRKKNPIGITKFAKISQGLYRINGQPLPADISIELDGTENETVLEKVFSKNKILPLKNSIYKKASKSILRDSDDKLIINILEGASSNSAASNLSIGYIEISGSTIKNDLIKGLDIQLDFHISESRDLTINLTIPSIEYTDFRVFKPSKKPVNYEKIISEIKYYINYIDEKDFNIPSSSKDKLRTIQSKLIQVYGEAIENQNDIQTDKLYRLDDSKRNLIRRFDRITNYSDITEEIESLKIIKNSFLENEKYASPQQKLQFEKLIKKEHKVIHSNNKYIIKSYVLELEHVSRSVSQNNPEFYGNIFFNLVLRVKESEIKNKKRWNELVLLGRKASNNLSFIEMKQIVAEMVSICNLSNHHNNDDIKRSLGIE